MLDVLVGDDVRRQDAACEARGIPTVALMEEAGWGVARAARTLLGGTAGRRIVAVCGKGNNGGDGLVAARHLARLGAGVTVVLCEPPAAGGAPAANLELFRPLGRVCSLQQAAREIERADLVVDAVLGVGLRRAPEGAAAVGIAAIAAARPPVVSVDVPSGVDADTGAVPGIAVTAAVTVTLGGLKPGLLFHPGRARAGRVVVHDIGVPADLRGGTASALEEADVRALLPRRAPGAHKRSSGVVLVVAGSRAMPGAAALVAAACVHGGAGLTTLAAPEPVCQVALARVPEITTIPLPETGEGTIGEKAVEILASRAGAFDAVVIGPGLSTHPAAQDAVRAFLAETALPAVVDADAITALAAAPDLLRRRAAPAVITPHAGELARLTGGDAGALEADRLGAARRAAAALGALVLFKGPGTVVCDPEGRAFVNTTGGESLAQGGTGDVLAGLIGALGAQRLRAGGTLDAPLVAAAAWLHGAAGDLAAARVAPHPANASMLVELIAEVVHGVAG